jgi:hypothetical protein
MSEKKNVLFFSSRNTGVSVEWHLPLALKLSDMGYRVSFMLLGEYSFEKSFENRFKAYKVLERFSIYYSDDLYPMGLFIKLYPWVREIFPSISNKFYRKPLWLICQTWNRIVPSNIFGKASRILSDNRFIFASNNPDWNGNKIESFFYKTSKSLDTIFIGTPLISWPHWYHKEVFPFDLLLTSSKQELNEINKMKAHPNAHFFGCPSLDIEYLAHQEPIENQADTHQGKCKTVLFIMVNSNHPMYLNFPIVKEVKSIISELISNDFKIIFKYHPKDSSREFNSFSNSDSNKFIVSTEPIETLGFKVDYVMTLLSTGILKTVALGKPSFLFIPESLLEAFYQQDELFKSVYFVDESLDKTWVDDFCNKFSNIDQFLLSAKSDAIKTSKSENFNSSFKPSGSSELILKHLIAQI